jgi:hypothetical protein
VGDKYCRENSMNQTEHPESMGKCYICVYIYIIIDILKLVQYVYMTRKCLLLSGIFHCQDYHSDVHIRSYSMILG